MIVEYIRYNVAAEQRENFIEAYTKAAQQLDASEYCLAYEVAECTEELGNFILRIEWTSQEEHLQGFRKSQVFGDFFANVKPFYSSIQEMRHYSKLIFNKKHE
jgi:quinol monooxygenase YgiN